MFIMYSISFLENCFNNENPMLFCKEKSVINLVWLPFKICTSLFMPNPNSRLSTHKSSIFTILFSYSFTACANNSSLFFIDIIHSLTIV